MSRRERDWDFIAWVKTQRCEARDREGHERCEGGIEAHHAGGVDPEPTTPEDIGDRPGMSRKAHDRTCIPLCAKAHREWTDHRGWVKGWPKAKRRAWSVAAIARTQAAYNRRQRGAGTIPF